MAAPPAAPAAALAASAAPAALVAAPAATTEALQVFVRVRPTTTSTTTANDGPRRSSVVVHAVSSNELRVDETTTYHVDRVFAQTCGSWEVYATALRPMVLAVLDGRTNGALFAYGRTGSGKSFTIDQLTRAALQDVYDKKQDATARLDISLSSFQIYNDKVFDLLDTSMNSAGKPLIVRQIDRDVHLVDLREETCSTMHDAWTLWERAKARRTKGETKHNAQSSRSHAFLWITVRGTSGGTSNLDADGVMTDAPRTWTNRLQLVDLAGNEKSDAYADGSNGQAAALTASMTATSTSGWPASLAPNSTSSSWAQSTAALQQQQQQQQQQLQQTAQLPQQLSQQPHQLRSEGVAINRSLLSFCRLLRRFKHTHTVPSSFRECTLTQIFFLQFTTGSLVAALCCIHDSPEHLHTIQQTLKFAIDIKGQRMTATSAAPSRMTTPELLALINDLRRENSQLRKRKPTHAAPRDGNDPGDQPVASQPVVSQPSSIAHAPPRIAAATTAPSWKRRKTLSAVATKAEAVDVRHDDAENVPPNAHPARRATMSMDDRAAPLSIAPELHEWKHVQMSRSSLNASADTSMAVDEDDDELLVNEIDQQATHEVDDDAACSVSRACSTCDARASDVATLQQANAALESRASELEQELALVRAELDRSNAQAESHARALEATLMAREDADRVAKIQRDAERAAWMRERNVQDECATQRMNELTSESMRIRESNAQLQLDVDNARVHALAESVRCAQLEQDVQVQRARNEELVRERDEARNEAARQSEIAQRLSATLREPTEQMFVDLLRTRTGVRILRKLRRMPWFMGVVGDAAEARDGLAGASSDVIAESSSSLEQLPRVG